MITFDPTTQTVLVNSEEEVTPTIVTDGDYSSCTSSDTSVVTCAYDSGVITLSAGSATGSATITLAFAAGTNYTAVSQTLAVTVASEGTATKPSAITGLVYNGSAQTGVPAGTGYTITGNTATDAGTHTATATLKSGYT